MSKKALVYYSDVGLFGTFVRLEAHPSEDEFVYLWYVPEGGSIFFPKKRRYPKLLPLSSIHRITPKINMKGVPDDIFFIHTAEEGSLLANILETDKETIDQLRDKVKAQEMTIASLKQRAEDAESGTKKAIASSRSLSRSNQENTPGFGFGSPIRDRYGNDEGFDSEFD